jgi:hypothetical protein
MPRRSSKPLPRNDQWKAPTPDMEGHRKRLREALGNTLSDEFVDVILGKLVEALRPGLYDQLDEATLNAALATIDSMQPRSELQALLAVQIIATGFAGLRFLRQSHRQMTEDSGQCERVVRCLRAEMSRARQVEGPLYPPSFGAAKADIPGDRPLE